MLAGIFLKVDMGKGAPDGVGAALKRAANSFVLHGKDITNTSTFMNCFKDKESNISLYEVCKYNIEKSCKFLASLKLKPVPGTLKLHQITTTSVGEIKYRDVSCLCEDGTKHKCHELKYFTFKLPPKENRERKSTNDHEKLNKDQTCSSKEQQSTVKPSREQVNEHVDERRTLFSSILERLHQCRTYQDITIVCNQAKKDVEKFQLNSHYSASVLNTGISVDDFVLEISPHDTVQTVALFPVTISVDGNCLPYCGSVHVFGNEQGSNEMRVSIIMELVMYKDLYQTQEHLTKGLPESNMIIQLIRHLLCTQMNIYQGCTET